MKSDTSINKDLLELYEAPTGREKIYLGASIRIWPPLWPEVPEDFERECAKTFWNLGKEQRRRREIGAPLCTNIAEDEEEFCGSRRSRREFESRFCCKFGGENKFPKTSSHMRYEQRIYLSF